MNKQEYLDNKNKPRMGFFAGAVCGRCNIGYLGEQAVLDSRIEKRFKNKYKMVCGKCAKELNEKYANNS